MDQKQQYLCRELEILAWNASVQRANVYVPGLAADDPRKRRFRKQVLEFLARQLLPNYGNPMNEAEHRQNIERLGAHASGIDAELLSGGNYRFGVAQKLLNLTLKYHWCLGVVVEPPHCPVDRIVLKQTRRSDMSWTQIDDCGPYLEAIDAIRAVANRESLSIAMWELKCYARR